MQEKEEFLSNLDPTITYTLENIKNWEFIFTQVFKQLKVNRFLDIGAGQSNLAASLRKKGIEAFATDIAYAYKREHNQKVDSWLESEQHEDLEHFKELEEARKQFQDDFTQNPTNYIAAYSTHLPFKTNSFDLITSSRCIGTLVAVDYEELTMSISEIIRVLKPNGMAFIDPYDNADFIRTKEFREARNLEANQQKLLRLLKRTGHKFGIQKNPDPITQEYSHCLMIQKNIYGRPL